MNQEILGVVGRPGFAGEVLADFLDRLAGAALDDAFHDRGDLISGEGIEHSLPFVDESRLFLILPCRRVAPLADLLVVPVDRMTPAVLDAVDQGFLDFLPPLASIE